MCQESKYCHLEISSHCQNKHIYISTSDVLHCRFGLVDFFTSGHRYSSRIGSSIYCMLIVFLVVSTLPLATFAFNSDRTTQSNQEATGHSGKISCPRHFGHRVQSCVAPFTSLLDLYNANADHLGQAVTIAKHICIEYQMVLLCLHSALSDCPTLKNLKRVQDTLDSQWVSRINDLCSIQSKTSTEVAMGEHKDLKNYISNKNADNHMDSQHIAREILQASLKTREELEQEIISGHTMDAPLPSVPETKRILSAALQKDVDYLTQKLPSTIGSEAKLELNIVNFIQNYNYATAQKNDQLRQATIRLIHTDYNSSAPTTYSLSTISLLCTVLIFVWLMA
ncbi:hypothetical protein Btru_072080 [Bulinus truncatus]|nr:hypothetical protein Btru_072080 [Bulinus truncatus]